MANLRFRRSAENNWRRFQSNLDIIFKKYDRPFPGCDIICMSNLSIFEDKGHIKGRLERKAFGECNYPFTPPKDITSYCQTEATDGEDCVLLNDSDSSTDKNLSVGAKGPQILHVQSTHDRLLETTCDDILAEFEHEPEPSDAETLSSCDDDDEWETDTYDEVCSFSSPSSPCREESKPVSSPCDKVSLRSSTAVANGQSVIHHADSTNCKRQLRQREDQIEYAMQDVDVDLQDAKSQDVGGSRTGHARVPSNSLQCYRDPSASEDPQESESELTNCDPKLIALLNGKADFDFSHKVRSTSLDETYILDKRGSSAISISHIISLPDSVSQSTTTTVGQLNQRVMNKIHSSKEIVEMFNMSSELYTCPLLPLKPASCYQSTGTASKQSNALDDKPHFCRVQNATVRDRSRTVPGLVVTSPSRHADASIDEDDSALNVSTEDCISHKLKESLTPRLAKLSIHTTTIVSPLQAFTRLKLSSSPASDERKDRVSTQQVEARCRGRLSFASTKHGVNELTTLVPKKHMEMGTAGKSENTANKAAHVAGKMKPHLLNGNAQLDKAWSSLLATSAKSKSQAYNSKLPSDIMQQFKSCNSDTAEKRFLRSANVFSPEKNITTSFRFYRRNTVLSPRRRDSKDHGSFGELLSSGWRNGNTYSDSETDSKDADRSKSCRQPHFTQLIRDQCTGTVQNGSSDSYIDLTKNSSSMHRKAIEKGLNPSPIQNRTYIRAHRRGSANSRDCQRNCSDDAARTPERHSERLHRKTPDKIDMQNVDHPSSPTLRSNRGNAAFLNSRTRQLSRGNFTDHDEERAKTQRDNIRSTDRWVRDGTRLISEDSDDNDFGRIPVYRFNGHHVVESRRSSRLSKSPPKGEDANDNEHGNKRWSDRELLERHCKKRRLNTSSAVSMTGLRRCLGRGICDRSFCLSCFN